MSDDAKNQLKAAAKKVKAAEAAKRRKAEQEQEEKNRKGTLFLEAARNLKDIQYGLYKKLGNLSDEISIAGDKVTLGDGKITFLKDIKHISNQIVSTSNINNDYTTIKMYRKMGYEAIAGTYIGVTCKSQKYTHSATLLYLRKEKEEQFRWYQVAFKYSGLVTKPRYSATYPFHLEPNNFDIYLACTSGFHDIEVAYGPDPIDGDDYQNFEQHWISLLAAAAIGELSQK